MSYFKEMPPAPRLLRTVGPELAPARHKGACIRAKGGLPVPNRGDFMFGFLFKKIFGSKNERYLRRLRPLVQRINA